MIDSAAIERTRAKEAAWRRIAQRFDAMAYRQRVRAWLAHSALYAVDSAGTQVAERYLGRLVALTVSGERIPMDAPVPLA